MKKVMGGINKVYDLFDKVNQALVLFLMSAMCLDLLAQVVFRYLFSHPLTWSEELARYIFVWIALFGAAWCGRHHIHVRMTAVVGMLPVNVQRWLQFLVSFICAACCWYLLPHAIKIFVAQSKLTAVTLGVSLGIEYIAAPCGLGLLAIQQTVDALFVLLDWEGYKGRYMSNQE